ncbi:MarR family transcriptional regulator [Streptomyces sp. NPDC051322]|uniref:MarR family transcriptional regulator n=1 Tax=Streptomyces sp. NPDC051322 TaxID=3154645 RepID=UPI00344E341A
MATQNSSAALRAPAAFPAHPMATAGYGKRSAPDQTPRQADDFLLLPERERYIAAFIDRLRDGAAMTIKTLAKQLPHYGQQAVSTALTALSVAGHLRRVRCLTGTGDQVRWAFRTFWSRTARDNEWWTTFLAAEGNCVAGKDPETTASAPDRGPADAPVKVRRAPAPPAAAARATPPAPAPTPVTPQQPERVPEHSSPAYQALAQLGVVEQRLALSAEDCEELEGLAMEWLARGVTPAYIVQVLAAGLPAKPINSPLGFVRHRLREKTPPHQSATPTPNAVGAPSPGLMVECTKCGTPGRPEALPDGLCRPCRRTPPSTQATTNADTGAQTVPPRDVHTHVEALRSLARNL